LRVVELFRNFYRNNSFRYEYQYATIGGISSTYLHNYLGKGEKYGHFLWLSSSSLHQYLDNMKIIISYNKLTKKKKVNPRGLSSKQYHQSVWDKYYIIVRYDNDITAVYISVLCAYHIIIHDCSIIGKHIRPSLDSPFLLERTHYYLMILYTAVIHSVR